MASFENPLHRIMKLTPPSIIDQSSPRTSALSKCSEVKVKTTLTLLTSTFLVLTIHPEAHRIGGRRGSTRGLTSRELKLWRACLSSVHSCCSRRDSRSLGSCWSLSDLVQHLQERQPYGCPGVWKKLDSNQRPVSSRLNQQQLWTLTSFRPPCTVSVFFICVLHPELVFMEHYVYSTTLFYWPVIAY